MFTLSWLILIGVVGGALALVDGILRLRARRGSTIVGVIEIIVASLFILSLFVQVIPWSWLVLGVALLVVLIIALITRGRTGPVLPIVALLLVAFWLILMNRWLVIPGIN